MVYWDFKDLTRRTVSDKILCDKTFNFANNTQYDGHQRQLASMFYILFHKKTSSETTKMKIFLIKTSLKNYTNQLYEISMLILLICILKVNLIKDLDFYYAQLTFIANIQGLFL